MSKHAMGRYRVVKCSYVTGRVIKVMREYDTPYAAVGYLDAVRQSPTLTSSRCYFRVEQYVDMGWYRISPDVWR